LYWDNSCRATVRKDVDGDRVLILVHVSSKPQSDNSRKNTQLEALKEVIEKIDATVIEILETEESELK